MLYLIHSWSTNICCVRFYLIVYLCLSIRAPLGDIWAKRKGLIYSYGEVPVITATPPRPPHQTMTPPPPLIYVNRNSQTHSDSPSITHYFKFSRLTKNFFS